VNWRALIRLLIQLQGVLGLAFFPQAGMWLSQVFYQ